MNTNHTPGTLYPVGTRYSNSIVYDEATAEVVHGFQVFRQMTAQGEPTGRLSFINNRGTLCGIEIAEQERQRARQDAAADMLAALQSIVDEAGPQFGHDDGPGTINRISRVSRLALAKAAGI